MMIFRFLLALGVGVVAGAVVPIAGGDSELILVQLSTLSIRLARFWLYPTIFFGIIVAADELREDRALVMVLLRTAVAVLVVVVGGAIIGALAVIGLQPQRIPPILQEAAAVQLPRLLPFLVDAVPANAFRTFVLGDQFLLPIVIFGLLIGTTFIQDREVSEPISLFCDSTSRVFFRMNRTVVALMGVLLIAPTMLAVVRLRSGADMRLYGQLLLVVLVAAAFIVLVVYPVVLWLLLDRRAIGPWLKSLGATTITAIATADVYLSLTATIRFGNEDLAVPRRSAAVVLPFAAAFGRAGSTMVVVAGFLLVMRSYTALDIGLTQVVFIIVSTFGLSFALARTPMGSVLLLLSYLSLVYGRGMEESYLILLPIMPVLERVAAVTDAATASVLSLVIAGRSRYWRIRPSGA